MATDSDGDRVFRELDAEHRPRAQRTVDYAFDAAGGPTDYADATETPDRLGRQFGVFEDGALRSVCTHYDLTARVRDRWLPMGGLAAVATPPEHRRRGLVRTAVRGSLRRWRGETPVSTLWPFDHGYYRRFGWALSNTAVEYTCPPSALAAARRGAADGQFRRVDPAEWERLQDVHEAHGRARGLTLRRDGEWWRHRVFTSIAGQQRYVYALERGGRVDGYLAYTVDRDGPHLRVADLAFRDHASYLAVLAFLADHDSQAERVSFHREGGDRSLLDVVEDPGAVDASVTPGPQVRIVDVEHALSALSGGGSATLTLAVTDDHAPWNDGRFRVSVTEGAWDCTRVGADDADADAAVDIGTLSQLYVGHHGPGAARHHGGLEADDETVETMASLFPPRTVYLREFF